MKDHIANGALKELIKEKSKVCVSIIIPLDLKPSFQKSNKALIKYILEKLNVLMNQLYKPTMIAAFTKRIKELEGKINITPGTEGLGIFISPNVLKFVEFSYPVKEKLAVSDSFELRDVLANEFYLKDYCVLSMTAKEAHLLKGNANSFEEIKNKDFPMFFTDDYEYSKTSRGTSFGNTLKQFEKDKSIVKEMRTTSFYHEIDKKLTKYLSTDVPLIIAGVKKDLGYFEKETGSKELVSGKILGSYDGYNAGELRAQAWKKMKAHFVKEEKKIIDEIKELVGRKLATTGLQQVWRDAKAGKGNILVVERDFIKPAFLAENESRLLFDPPKGEHKIINDAVDDIIEMVFEKNGSVIFADNGKLKDFGGIALIKRY